MNDNRLNHTCLNAYGLNFTRLNVAGGTAARGSVIPPVGEEAAILTEQGGFFLLENGGRMLLEESVNNETV